MPTSPANPSNPFDNTKDQYQIALIKKALDPTNPYAAYNNTDRFLNVSYRLFTTGKLKKTLELHQQLVYLLPGGSGDFALLDTPRAVAMSQTYRSLEEQQYSGLWNTLSAAWAVQP